jgi:general secretion pathway protein D
VRDGETFVIGGLTQENSLASNSKIPMLGDIPVVGNLFRVNRSTRSKTELYIVITPHIVRHRRFEPAYRSLAPAAVPPPLPNPVPPDSIPLGSPLDPADRAP